MNEATRKKVMYAILVAAIIFGVWNFTHPTNRRGPGPTPEATTTGSALVDSTAVQVAQVSALDLTARQNQAWGRDPFTANSNVTARPAVERPRTTAKPTATAAVVPGFRLSGIIYNKKTPMAVINGQMVGVGDEVDQARVKYIDQSKVTIIYNGSAIDLLVSKG
ncbi:MAG: hypothetical protein WAU88_16145 [Candidatus Zixiibacteriota bacterium]